MRNMRNMLKTVSIIALVLGFFFAPILESVSAMSYNYDFWKNIIPSAEGIAHQDTYYADNFDYYKNEKYEAVVQKLNKLLDDLKLEDIKAVVSKEDYSSITSDDYNNAIIALDTYNLADSVKAQIKDLINEKQEYEADPNLYKKISFNTIMDIQVFEDKVYVLSTPVAMNVSNITGTENLAELTQLIVINNDMKWEACVQEFEITEDVRNTFDNYYQWNRLGFQSVASGKNHTVAVDTSGNIWAWGSNEYGQLGLNPAEVASLDTPQQITWIGDEKAIKYVSVYTTDNATFALDSKGILWGFGKNDNGLISSDATLEYTYEAVDLFSSTKKTAKYVAVADDHIYVIDNESKLWAWGDNSDNLLFVSGEPKTVKSPTLTQLDLKRKDEINNKEIALKPVSIHASKSHTLIVDDEGSLWAWGDNTYGQLGLGHNDSVTTPTTVELKKNNVTVKVESASVGDYHTLLIDKLGGLWSFGSNSHFQLGFEKLDGTPVQSINKPYAFDHDVEYVKVNAFGNSSFAIDLESNYYVFGQNDQYQLSLGNNTPKVEYTVAETQIALASVTGSANATFGLDTSSRLWIWGTNDKSLGFGSSEDITTPKYNEQKLVLKNIALSGLSNSDIYRRAIYVAYSKDENIPAVYLRSAAGVAVNENYIYISDTQNSRILRVNKETYVVDDICLTPANSTFKQLNLDSSAYQPSTLRQFKPTKITVSPTGRVYAIAEQVYEGIIEFNKQGDYNRYLGQNDVVTNPLKELLRDYLTEEQLASFALTLPPLFTSISTDSKGFIYATSYPDTDSGNVANQNMVKAINTSGKDCMKRNGYVLPNGDAVYVSSSPNAQAVLGPSYLVDVTINKDGNFTVVDEVRGRMFTYDSDGNLLYITGNQPGGTKQSSGNLSENIIKPVALDYLYRTYVDAKGEVVEEEIIIVADQQSKSLMYYETTEFGRLVNEATAAYTKGVDTAEKAQAVKAIWEEVRQRNTNYELAYLGIGKCLLVESDYVETKEEQLELYQEAMENFRLAHSGTYYSKAFGRYRDQVLKDNFDWIMTGAIILILAIAGFTVYKTIKAKQAKKIRVQGGKK